MAVIVVSLFLVSIAQTASLNHWAHRLGTLLLGIVIDKSVVQEHGVKLLNCSRYLLKQKLLWSHVGRAVVQLTNQLEQKVQGG